MKILIVGGAGFIGSMTAGWLIQQTNYAVVSIDNLSVTKDVYNLEPAIKSPRRHSFYVANIFDDQIMRGILRIEQPDVIVVATTPNAESYCRAGQLYALAKEEGIVLDRIIQIASHKDHKGLYDDFYQSGDVEPGVIRVFSCRLFGPRQQARHFVPATISSILNDRIPNIHANGSDVQEWLYAHDFFTALLAIIRTDSPGSSYTVSAGYFGTEAEIADSLLVCMGHEPLFKVSAVIVPNEIDTAEIRELGWFPKTDLSAALEHTASWYAANKWGLR